MKRMLLVFAHPDDESFTSGGVISKYVKAGWDIHLVCATKGEAGEHGPYDAELTDTEVGEIREKELRDAAKILGIQKITLLGYKDGMLSSQHAGELEDKIFHIMASSVPQIVITFGPDGITNHPDHTKLSLSTTYAFQKYVEGLVAPKFKGIRGVNVVMLRHEYQRSLEESEKKEYIEPKLYYACVPESVVHYLQKEKIFPTESFGKPIRGISDDTVTTVVDVSRYKSIKNKALSMHKTQQHDVGKFFRLPNQPLILREYFVLRMQGQYEVYMGKKDRISPKL